MWTVEQWRLQLIGSFPALSCITVKDGDGSYEEKKKKDLNTEAPEQMQSNVRAAKSIAHTVTRTDKAAATCSVSERGREDGVEKRMQ